MKRFWLIAIEGTPKAVERFEELLDTAVIDASHDGEERKKALRTLTSWWFKDEKALTAFIQEAAIRL